MQMPSEVRPQRPLRWLAEACEIGSIGSRCTLVRWLYREMRAVPGSMTYLMPGTVSEVSATLVASTTRRVRLEAGRRSKTRCCSAADSREYRGSMSSRSRPASRSAVSRISRSPDRNTRMSPGPAAESSSIASLIAWPWSPSSSHRPVPHLHRVGPAGYLDDRRAAEGGREPLRVDGRRGDDHLQVRAAGQQLPEVAEDEVDVQAALVRLVDDQRVVAAQVPVAGELVQHDAVGHQLHQRVAGRHVGEPDLVADRLAQRAAQFLGDPLGHRPGRQPPRLGVADLPVDAAAELQADLGYLGGLARAGLPRDDHDLVVADGPGDLVLALADGQLGGIGDRRHGRAAGGPRAPRARQRAQHATWIARDARTAAGRARRGKTSQNSTPYRREE